MSSDGPTNMFDGELAALQRRREMDSLSTSPVSGALSKIAEIAEQFGMPGAGLFASALRSGKPPAENVVEQIEKGAYEEITRIWKHLEGQDARLKDFGARLRSQEAQNAYVSAVLHGLRTSDPSQQMRVGALTINCVYASDLEPESLDDMMRAAVELTEHDTMVLESIYEMQAYLFTPQEMAKAYNFRLDAIRSRWREWWKHEGAVYLKDGGAAFRSSTVHLQSTGLIASIGSASVLAGPSVNEFELLPEGKRFCERLQRIGAKK